MPRSASIFFRSFTGIALSSSRLAVMSGSSTLGALRGCGCGFAPSAATCTAQHTAQLHQRPSERQQLNLPLHQYYITKAGNPLTCSEGSPHVLDGWCKR
jgi:hypothetical protein